MLIEDEIRRYERQTRIFGEEGQEKLKNAEVFTAGAGGLGSSSSIYLAVAGIGKIRIVDHDIVELSNLNRQILHWNEDVGRRKVGSATEKLARLNPEVKIEAIEETITEANISELVADSDLIVDAMDNFPTRYLLNKTAIKKNIPFFYGAVHGFWGQATTIIPGKTACLRCVFPKAPPSIAFPIVGVTTGVIGCIQATEVIKYILEMGSLLQNRLLMWDGLNATINEVALERDPRCEDCGGQVGSE